MYLRENHQKRFSKLKKMSLHFKILHCASFELRITSYYPFQIGTMLGGDEQQKGDKADTLR
jgi:hypothetical protein